MCRLLRDSAVPTPGWVGALFSLIAFLSSLFLMGCVLGTFLFLIFLPFLLAPLRPSSLFSLCSPPIPWILPLLSSSPSLLQRTCWRFNGYSVASRPRSLTVAGDYKKAGQARGAGRTVRGHEALTLTCQLPTVVNNLPPPTSHPEAPSQEEGGTCWSHVWLLLPGSLGTAWLPSCSPSRSVAFSLPSSATSGYLGRGGLLVVGPSVSGHQGCYPGSLCISIAPASAASKGWLFLLPKSEPLATQPLSPASRPLALS